MLMFNNEMTIAREEIFGPVLSILPYKDEEEAVQIANDTDYGLFGYVSGDTEHAKKIANRIRAGSISINGAQADFTAPFGGYKQSGNGRGMGTFWFRRVFRNQSRRRLRKLKKGPLSGLFFTPNFVTYPLSCNAQGLRGITLPPSPELLAPMQNHAE